MSEVLEPPAGRFPDESSSPSRPAPPAPARPATSYEVLSRAEMPAHLLQKKDPTPKLNAAVADVLEEMKWVEKRGHNTHFNYAYSTADDIRDHVAGLIGKHGLSYEIHEGGYYPVIGNMIACVYWFKLVHESGEESLPEKVTSLTFIQNSKGPDDKAFSKAKVLATKDWAKTRLSIPTGEDPRLDPDFSDEPPAPDEYSHPIPGKNSNHPTTPPKSRTDRLADKVSGKAGNPPKQEEKKPTAEQIESAKKFAREFIAKVDAAPGHVEVADYCLVPEVGRAITGLRNHFGDIYRGLVRECVAPTRAAKMIGVGQASAEFYDDINAESAAQAERAREAKEQQGKAA